MAFAERSTGGQGTRTTGLLPPGTWTQGQALASEGRS